MSMSATANVFGDELFNLSVDVVPRINLSLETGIFFWRRIFSGRAGADGGLLPENRRQRIVENPSRSMRLRTKLTPFFVWLHQRASRGADCSAMSTSIVRFADSNASLWMSSRAATDTTRQGSVAVSVVNVRRQENLRLDFDLVVEALDRDRDAVPAVFVLWHLHLGVRR
jgi:hypothetical protein